MPCIDRQPITEWHINNRDMILYEDFRILFVYQDVMFNITIKKGFIFDGMSSPQALWSITGSPFTGPSRIPAFLHDALYRCADRSKMIRSLADDIFEFLMEQFGESSILEELKYQAVDKFGQSAWDEGTKNLQPQYLELERYPI